MDLTLVDSSLIYGVDYDDATQELTVIFKSNGARYVYEGVPQNIYDHLLAADSIGRFFLKHIKEHYPFRQ